MAQDVLTEFAPAKINLYLHVVGKRSDGYHLLESLAAFAAIGDTLRVTEAPVLSLAVTGPFAAALQVGADNLVLRAATALADRLGYRPSGRIVLEKRLPVASGIGGGSADAAAAVRLLLRHWKMLPDPSDIRAVVGRLGADVPVCLASRTVFMSGIGETLAVAPPLPDIGVVLVNPGVPVSTAAVFAAHDGLFSARPEPPPEGWATPAGLVSFLDATRNDLQALAIGLVPQIAEVLAAVQALPGCLLARMSGSGGTCFGIFESPEAAQRAVQQIESKNWWAWGGGVRGDSASAEVTGRSR
jgi:4-diphosphocytidyl-2-C-methyl-D-erythritol kinase